MNPTFLIELRVAMKRINTQGGYELDQQGGTNASNVKRNIEGLDGSAYSTSEYYMDWNELDHR